MSSNHPDYNDIERMLNIAAEKMNTTFEVVFQITEYDAEQLIACWDDANSGDTTAVYALMSEIRKLVEVLKEEMSYGNHDGYDTDDFDDLEEG